MEGASLALGIVPVVILAAQAYRTLYDGIRTLRDNKTVATRVLLRLNCLEIRLRNIFRDFLAPVLPGQDPRKLFKDNSVSDVQKKAIEAHMNQVLGLESGTCRGVLEEISKIFNEVRVYLVENETAASDNAIQHGKIKASKAALTIALSESRYHTKLDDLRKWIDDLSHILKPRVQHMSNDEQISALPTWISAINEASTQLSAGLEKVWTCSNEDHGDHSVALWLDARLEADRAVHMDVAICCNSNGSAMSSSCVSSSLVTTTKDIWLHVRSASSTAVNLMPQNRKQIKPPTRIPYRPATATTHPSRSHRSVPNHPSTPPQNKSNHADTLKLDLEPRRNFHNLPSVCCHLHTNNFSRPQTYSKCCHGFVGNARGYLGTATGYEHLIIDRKGPTTLSESSRKLSDESRPLIEVLHELGPSELIRAASKITLGLLKYWNTPWLQEEWSLSDISQFKSSPFDLSTLHVYRPLPRRKDRNHVISHVTDTQGQGNVVTSTSGRTPLVSLAIALLEFAYRRPFQDLRLENEADDITTARRLIPRIDMMFGFGYRSLVRMCLDGDFVLGCSNFKDSRVQTAVYNRVTLKLDQLAQKHEELLRDI